MAMNWAQEVTHRGLSGPGDLQGGPVVGSGPLRPSSQAWCGE